MKRYAILAFALGALGFALTPILTSWADPVPQPRTVNVTDCLGTDAPPNGTDLTAAYACALALLPVSGPTYGGTVVFPGGSFEIACDQPLRNGVRVLGQGQASTLLSLRPNSTCQKGVFVVSPGAHWAQIERITIAGNRGSGSTTPAVVDLRCVFVGSLVRDVLLRDFTSVGLLGGCESASNANSGPVSILNVWAIVGTGSPQPGTVGIALRGSGSGWALTDVTTEHADVGVFIEGPLGKPMVGAARLTGTRISSLHVENVGAAVKVVNAGSLVVDGIQVASDVGMRATVEIAGQNGSGVYSPHSISLRDIDGRSNLPYVKNLITGAVVMQPSGKPLLEWSLP